MSGYQGSPIASLPLLAGFIDDDDVLPTDAGAPLSTQKVTAGTLRTAPTSHPAGKYFDICDGLCSQGTPAAQTADSLLLIPWRGFSAKLVSTAVGLRVTVSGGASAGFKAAVWELDPATGLPTGFPVAIAQAVPGDMNGTGMIDAIWDGAGTPTWTHRTDTSYAMGLVFNNTGTVTVWANTNLRFRQVAGIAPGASAGGTQHGWTIAHTYANTLNRDLTGAVLSSLTGVVISPYLKAQ